MCVKAMKSTELAGTEDALEGMSVPGTFDCDVLNGIGVAVREETSGDDVVGVESADHSVNSMAIDVGLGTIAGFEVDLGQSKSAFLWLSGKRWFKCWHLNKAAVVDESVKRGTESFGIDETHRHARCSSIAGPTERALDLATNMGPGMHMLFQSSQPRSPRQCCTLSSYLLGSGYSGS